MGASCVGKSSIAQLLLQGKIPNVYESTIEDTYKTVYIIDNTKCAISLLDTGGISDYENMQEQWITKSDAFMLVYAVNDLASFETIERILKKIKSIKKKRFIAVLVSNKVDLIDSKQVDDEKVKRLTRKYDMKIFETSALVCI